MTIDTTGWRANMITYGTARKNDMLGWTLPPVDINPPLAAYYYDAAWVFYQIGAYLNDTASWYPVAKHAIQVYRDYYLVPNSYLAPGYWNFTDGLRRDWEITGDIASQQAVIQLSINASYARDSTPDSSLADANAETSSGGAREAAYALRSYLDAEACGAARRSRTAFLVTTLLSHMDQWGTGLAYSYVPPFMVGIACEALIRAVGAGLVDEATVKAKMTTVFTYLNAAYNAPTKSYQYYDRVVNNPADTNPAPDLNMLISPALQWLGGAWITRANDLWDGGVAGAYLGAGKQFNQNYRWSFQQLTWEAEQQGGGNTSPPEGNTEPSFPSINVCLPKCWTVGNAMFTVTQVDVPPAPPIPDPPVPPDPEAFVPSDFGTCRAAYIIENSTLLNVGGTPATDGQGVATAQDSENSWDLTQMVDAGYRPIYKQNILNGYDVLRFDGVHTQLVFPNAFAKALGKITMIIVYNITNYTVERGLIRLVANGDNAFVASFQAGGFTRLDSKKSGGVDKQLAYNTVVAAGSWQIRAYDVDYAGNASLLEDTTGVLNGPNTLDGAGATANADAANNSVLGDEGPFGTYPFLGDMAAVLIYTAQTALQRTNCIAALKTRFAL